jgi:hypothetical protein
MQYIGVSSLTGENIEDAFSMLIDGNLTKIE